MPSSGFTLRTWLSFCLPDSSDLRLHLVGALHLNTWLSSGPPVHRQSVSAFEVPPKMVFTLWLRTCCWTRGPVALGWLQVKELVADTRTGCLLDVRRVPITGYAVHALKGSSVFFTLLNGEGLVHCGDWLSPGVPVFDSQLLFERRGGRLPAAVSGRRSCSKLEGRLPSEDRTRILL